MTVTTRKNHQPITAYWIGLISLACLTWHGAAAANMCSGGAGAGLFDEAFSSYAGNYGGVTLNKTLSLLNDVNEIKGAAFDPKKGEIVFIGDGVIPLAERIDMDDLVTAIKSVYIVQGNPGVTFHTPDIAKAFQTGRWDVSYFGATQGTQFGKILFEADYVLKQLSLGIDASGARLVNTHAGLNALGYKSYAQRLFENNITLNGLSIEFWFAPKVVSLDASESLTDAGKSFVFREW